MDSVSVILTASDSVLNEMALAIWSVIPTISDRDRFLSICVDSVAVIPTLSDIDRNLVLLS